MVRPVLDGEVKNAMFSIGNNKAPGTDWYTSKFFKEARGIVRVDVCKAVREFFTSGKLLKEINHTVIALFPKVSILNGMSFVKGELPIKYLGVTTYPLGVVFHAYLLGFSFLLPTRITEDIEQVMRGFLWCHGEMKKGKAKVAWNIVCLPKQEDGLDVVGDGSWLWPQAWYVCAPILNNCVAPNIILDRDDYMVWKDLNRNHHPFSTHVVWDVLRPRGNDVDWDDIVWFSICISHHAFLVWLIMEKRLKTHDMLRQWDVGVSTNLNLFLCPFCKLEPDSHNYLFFECNFCAQVWSMVRAKANMDDIGPNWEDIVNWIMPMSSNRLAISIIARLVLGATTYFIWKERNLRIFKNQSRTISQVYDIILHNVRLKLRTLNFKNTWKVRLILAIWNVTRKFADEASYIT
ncbi:reverse transcriptase domain, reverse transcriptase zinc-binding domain protein [Tanacetum coccineum]